MVISGLVKLKAIISFLILLLFIFQTSTQYERILSELIGGRLWGWVSRRKGIICLCRQSHLNPTLKKYSSSSARAKFNLSKKKRRRGKRQELLLHPKPLQCGFLSLYRHPVPRAASLGLLSGGFQGSPRHAVTLKGGSLFRGEKEQRYILPQLLLSFSLVKYPIQVRVPVWNSNAVIYAMLSFLICHHFSRCCLSTAPQEAVQDAFWTHRDTHRSRH